MARDHSEKKEESPQIIEREITLSLLNEKLNGITGLLLSIAEKTGAKPEED